MSIPDYQTLMLPLLKLVESSGEISIKEATNILAREFKLSAEERERILPSGNQTYIKNRVAWAGTYMKKAGLLLLSKERNNSNY